MIIRKIIKIAATRCHILKLKCTKFDFSCGALPQTPLGSLQRSPKPLAGFKGPTSKGRGKEGRGSERTQFGEDRCMQFRVIMVTVPQTNKPTNNASPLQTNRTDNNTLRRDSEGVPFASLTTHLTDI